jgi:hypothetical protein
MYFHVLMAFNALRTYSQSLFFAHWFKHNTWFSQHLIFSPERLGFHKSSVNRSSVVPNSSSEDVINRPKYLAYFGLFVISSSSKLDGLLEIISLVHGKPIDRGPNSYRKFGRWKEHCPYFCPGIETIRPFNNTFLAWDIPWFLKNLIWLRKTKIKKEAKMQHNVFLLI